MGLTEDGRALLEVARNEGVWIKAFEQIKVRGLKRIIKKRREGLLGNVKEGEDG